MTVRDEDTLRPARTTPPFSRAIRIAVGLSLVIAGLTNGLSQYIGQLVIGDLEFDEQMVWAVDHQFYQQAEQTILVASALFMPLGLLGIAQVTRWSAPRLTAVATVLFIWGMWGFHNILSIGYVVGAVAPDTISQDDAVRLEDSLAGNGSIWITALAPHLIGSFFGLVLLAVACWRSGSFPRIPIIMMVVFLVWDFVAPVAVGPFEAHLLLFISWTWLGVHLMRMSQGEWSGRTSVDQKP